MFDPTIENALLAIDETGTAATLVVDVPDGFSGIEGIGFEGEEAFVLGSDGSRWRLVHVPASPTDPIRSVRVFHVMTMDDEPDHGPCGAHVSPVDLSRTPRP